MKLYFVPIKIAAELKECGFDEECLSYYYTLGQFSDAVEEDDDINYPGDSRFYSFKNSSLGALIAAPLYDQVIDWFIKNKNLHIETYLGNEFLEEPKDVFSYLVLKHEKENGSRIVHVGVSNEKYESRWKALDAGIENAIKIIKG